MSKENKSYSQVKCNPNCHLCQGTGIANYFDVTELPEHVYGKEITMGEICDNYGHKGICPDCFPFPSNHSSN